ncbi:MAG: hypothetical protein WB586_09540 [Chthoniobacterales bacterium]
MIGDKRYTEALDSSPHRRERVVGASERSVTHGTVQLKPIALDGQGPKLLAPAPGDRGLWGRQLAAPAQTK